MDYRCPKHDLLFETLTDHRKPGALAASNFSAHPKDGHPDCPKCQEEASEQANAPSSHSATATSSIRVSNRKQAA